MLRRDSPAAVENVRLASPVRLFDQRRDRGMDRLKRLPIVAGQWHGFANTDAPTCVFCCDPDRPVFCQLCERQIVGLSERAGRDSPTKLPSLAARLHALLRSDGITQEPRLGFLFEHAEAILDHRPPALHLLVFEILVGAEHVTHRTVA